MPCLPPPTATSVPHLYMSVPYSQILMWPELREPASRYTSSYWWHRRRVCPQTEAEGPQKTHHARTTFMVPFDAME